jgi:hypothetical protein
LLQIKNNHSGQKIFHNHDLNPKSRKNMKISKIKTHNGLYFTHGIVFSSDVFLVFEMLRKYKKK